MIKIANTRSCNLNKSMQVACVLHAKYKSGAALSKRVDDVTKYKFQSDQ